MALLVVNAVDSWLDYPPVRFWIGGWKGLDYLDSKTLCYRLLLWENSLISLIKKSMNLSFSFLNKLVLISSPANELKKKNKIHDYSQKVWGSDYVFEPLNGRTLGCMTGVGKGVKSCDRIILQQGCESYQYQVEEIDYYSEPSDMWIALLKEVLVN